MTMTTPTTLFLPDRFDMLRRKFSNEVESIVVPVFESLADLDVIHRDVASACRGALLVLHGASGSGKSTFLNTVPLFRANVEVFSIPKRADIGKELNILSSADAATSLRLIVIENREALTDTSAIELEKALHEINTFVRSQEGERTIVAWPCNTDELRDVLVARAMRLGDAALLATGRAYHFKGPPKDEYFRIADKTIHVLNNGASISALGVSEDRANELAETCDTIGTYLLRLRGELLKNHSAVSGLLGKEQCRVWVVVCAGTEPEGEVAALTRGSYSTVDIDRITTATDANIVKELKKRPEKLGILGTVLDAKIIHLPIITALALIRSYASDALRKDMSAAGASTSRDPSALERLRSSELACAFRNEALGTRSSGGGPGSNSMESFHKLSLLASKNDIPLNEAIAKGLVEAGLIDGYKCEQDLGTGLKRRTDIFCETKSGPVRLEIMWRSKTSRAEIANYVLTKLGNYGAAIGFL